MTDLKEVTNNVHYENFRCRKLAGVGVTASDGTLGKSNRISNKLVSFFVDLFPDFFRCHFETQNVILSQKMKNEKGEHGMLNRSWHRINTFVFC
jgi:septin family protein